MFGWGKREIEKSKEPPFWDQVRDRLPTYSGLGAWQQDEWVAAVHRCYHVFFTDEVPKELADAISASKSTSVGGILPRSFLIQWFKTQPKLLPTLKVAMSCELIETILPPEVVDARKHLSKMGVELGLLGFSDVYQSIEVLTKYVEGLEKGEA